MKKLLILHGWGSNANRWQKFKEILEKKDIEVLVPTLPGFGDEKPPEKVWGVEEYEDWILDFVRQKGWENFNLLGHSFGGGLATKIAADFPQKIEKFILCAPAIIRERSRRIVALEKISKTGKKILNKIRNKKISDFFLKSFYRLIGAEDYYRSEGVMKEVIKKIFSQDLSSNLKKINLPTLILWGAKDEAVPLRTAYHIKGEIEKGIIDDFHKVKLIIFLNAGHCLNTEVPEKIAAQVFNFLFC
ncbi:MAG: alpha/beta hydrolase [Patescibacteria group bacterium]